ncbi:MAG: methyltransferase domain-containing protein [Vicinamibacterales bacterium]
MSAPTSERDRWNGPAGKAWVDARPMMDAMLRPLQDRLAAAPARYGARHVLDVGCGTGSTTMAIAEALPEGGTVVGADISATMLDNATARAAAAGSSARFVVADAQTHAFPEGAIDLVVSRFGVMFFEDPVAAFGNLHRATRPGGHALLIAWRTAADNPFMTTAERAVAPLLPDLPPRKTSGPGQFSFGDATVVREVLTQAGWRDVHVDPLDVPCAFPAAALDRYVTGVGPVGLALREADEATRARVLAVAREALAPFVHGDTVRFTAACWEITARA